MVHQVKMELPKRPLDEKVCRLIAGSHYNCSVSAYNVAGAGKPITSTVWTAPNSEYDTIICIDLHDFGIIYYQHVLHNTRRWEDTQYRVCLSAGMFTLCDIQGS